MLGFFDSPSDTLQLLSCLRSDFLLFVHWYSFPQHPCTTWGLLVSRGVRAIMSLGLQKSVSEVFNALRRYVVAGGERQFITAQW